MICTSKNGRPSWVNPSSGCDFMNKKYINLRIAKRERRLSSKKWTSALSKPPVGVRFYGKIFFILFYKSPQESVDFLGKNWRPPWVNPLLRCDFMGIVFVLFYKSQEAVDFFEKTRCPPWVNPLSGCDFMGKYFLYYSINHHKRSSIF